jgi:hypothetical protein
MDNKSPFHQRLMPALLFGLSFGLLAYEVVLLRVLTYLQWYHFAYLVISLALLGFGASGTVMHIFRPFWERHADRTFTAALLLTGITLAAVKPLLALLPMDTFLAVWHPWRLVSLALLCVVLFLPFLCGAFGLILVFSAAPQRIGLTYGANLLGSGVGALGGLLLLYGWHPLDIPPLLAVGMGILGVLHAGSVMLRPGGDQQGRNRLAGMVITLVGLVVIGLLGWGVPVRPAMSPYKALSRIVLMPDTDVLLESHSPLGILDVVQGPTLRSATGLSLSYQGDIRPQAMVTSDGNVVGALPILSDTSWNAPLRHTTFALPYRVRFFGTDDGAPQQVLVLNAGTGSEVHQALMEGSGAVTAVIQNPDLIQTLDDLAERDSALSTMYRRPRVQVVLQEPRGYLYQETGPYEVIMIPPAGGVGTAAAMQAVYEDHLLTVEGIGAALERLSPEGILCMTTWLDSPPRRILKLVALLAGAWERSAAMTDSEPGDHLIVIGSWNAATVVLSRRPWSQEEQERIRHFAAVEGFDVLFPPDGGAATAYHELADTTLVSDLTLLASGDMGQEELSSPFHMLPPTDDRPFFHHFLTMRAMPIMRDALGTAGLMLAEWGYVLLWITLALLVVGGTGLILLPLWLYRGSWIPAAREDLPTRPLSLVYFAAIGCGFMLVEIVLIQKLVLVLGDPVYSTAAVITALLVFAGVGSGLSERWVAAWSWSVPGAVVLIILLLTLLFGGVTILGSGWASLAKGARFTLVIVSLAPLALVMGIFFPTGVRWLDTDRANHFIPWAWGINGFASVVTTPVATIVALNLGFRVVAVLAAGCYLLAVAVSLRCWTNRQANQPAPNRSPMENSHQG